MFSMHKEENIVCVSVCIKMKNSLIFPFLLDSLILKSGMLIYVIHFSVQSKDIC